MKIISGLISIIFIILASLHIFVDAVTIDVIAIMLIVLASLPWTLPYLKSFELPGGVKIELKDVQTAIEKVSGGDDEPSVETSDYDYLKVISAHDPSLALVAIRIEIEKAVRSTLDSEERPIPLSRAINELISNGTITRSIASGLTEFIQLGNQAAHGVEVDAQAADYVIENAANILKPFKEQLANAN
ncbi:DUF4145 domain-containing protein [Leucothrix arctica]|uniref:DUF4145 domain-containing protein n=1 Tax=Leucothrix arctica TaxID=1481894 RepID=A0A317CG72_9GAMM|nr:DUF4145 domain-containing protein [Leucothrix arctica]PWQ97565.1 hypothetical protein DKT75_06505 [Leucothrix arctica]